MPNQNPVLMREEDDGGLRLLLIGKAGSGKSATGSTMFNETVFLSKISPSSVTRVCQTHTSAVNNRRVTLIDTPDFRFSTLTDFDSDSELKRALELCSPGAHVILLVLSLSTFTEQEMDFIHWFEQKFGAEALRFTLVLFTHADQRHMRTLGEMIRGNTQLSAFINRCGGGFCGMNNKDRANRRQVTELMEKIHRLVSENTNSCYTLERMEENERRREEDRRTAEEEKKREEEWREREHQMTLETVRRETETRVRREFEEKTKILEKQEEVGKREKPMSLPKMKRRVCVFVVFAVVTGVSFWKKDYLCRWALMRGFLTAGSAAAVGVFTGILWRLLRKSRFMRICSSSHERPSAVGQFLLKTAGVVCGGVFAGVAIHPFVGANLLPISVLAGAAGAFTAMHWSSSFFTKMFNDIM